MGCFAWKLVGLITTATAVAILEVALGVSFVMMSSVYLYMRNDCTCSLAWRYILLVLFRVASLSGVKRAGSF